LKLVASIYYYPKYPPFFTYKKSKNGNYTFEGVFKDHLEIVLEYLNSRLLNQTFFVVDMLKTHYFHENSIKYIILDSALLAEYGLYGALDQYLDKKVEK